MSRTRTSSAWLVLWGALLFLSLRPVDAVERALDVALAPLGWVAQLGAPFALVHAREVAAAERELARGARAEAAEGAETLARLAARALPSDPALLEGRHFIPAEVLERPRRDECWALAASAVGLTRGAPVVCGDVYVGRVVEVRPGPETRVRVQLVTAKDFRIGAEVRGEDPLYLVVGGVRAPRRGSEARVVRLAVHQPSAAGLAGLVRVHELFPEGEDSGGLAEGFRLGELRRAGEREPAWVEPELDYLDGLFQLAILVSEEAADPLGVRGPGALEDGRWLGTRALTSGDPSPWRSTLKIPLGRAQGLSAGAAVTGAGARLLGRVIRAGLASSDVALLSDPGLTLTAVARIEGASEPRILGRLTALGRGPEGTIRMRWYVRVPLELGATGQTATARAVRARVFTGSGEPGLPGGLLVGTVELPRVVRAGEEHELLLDPGIDPAGVRTLFVRRAGAETRP